VVVWQLKGSDKTREAEALRLIGIAWLALTALGMFALVYGKSRTGSALGNRVLQTEARVTAVDGLLALAILVGLVLNAALGWWWADPAAALVIAGGRAAIAGVPELVTGFGRSSALGGERGYVRGAEIPPASTCSAPATTGSKSAACAASRATSSSSGASSASSRSSSGLEVMK
jgi:predicted lysophospholipase L1 biosynthesis ABC-type transport system permease subunit